MPEYVYDYYPNIERAREAKNRLKRKGYNVAIRKVFMSDVYVLYIKEHK